MLIFILAVTSLFADEMVFMPEPPAGTDAIIERMGSQSYHEREAACKELEMLGWPVLKAVGRARLSGSPEIQWRAEKVYDSYFRLDCEEPPIWYINEKLRFPRGFKLEVSKLKGMSSVCREFPKDVPDVARKFYELACRKMECHRDGCEYTHPNVSKYATFLYTRSLLIGGKPRQEVGKIVAEANRNVKKYWHYYQSDNLDNLNYDWEMKPPGPMILKKEFVEPIHPYGGP